MTLPRQLPVRVRPEFQPCVESSPGGRPRNGARRLIPLDPMERVHGNARRRGYDAIDHSDRAGRRRNERMTMKEASRQRANPDAATRSRTTHRAPRRLRPWTRRTPLSWPGSESQAARNDEGDQARTAWPAVERVARLRGQALLLRGTFRPLPQAGGHCGRQAGADLPRRQHDLSPVMALVGHEVGQHVADVQRQIPPHVGRAGGNLAAAATTPAVRAPRCPGCSCSARRSTARRLTFRRSTADGTGMPWGRPRVLSHMHRLLWRWPASMRIVFRGAPGTGAAQTAVGMWLTRKTVT